MRVIAGRFRGVRLDAPAGLTTRPMTDQVKETVFNILGARLATPGTLPTGAVLDLFAGSGALGIEALSRGASEGVFIERNRRVLATLRRNLDQLNPPPTTRIVNENAWTCRLPRVEAGFPLAFVDPPFRDVANSLRLIDLLDRVAVRLSPDGLVVFRHDVTTEVSLGGLERLTVVDDRVFGRNRFLLLARRGGDAAADEQVEEKRGADEIGDDANGDLV